MAQSQETVGPAITNSATESLSVHTNRIFSNWLQLQVLLHFHFLKVLSCYLGHKQGFACLSVSKQGRLICFKIPTTMQRPVFMPNVQHSSVEATVE